MGGGGVMVWAGIGHHGKADLVFIDNRLNSQGYVRLLRDQLEKHTERIFDPIFIFQQDNAAVHTAKIVREHFEDDIIGVLAWPARSPDLNIIENVWSTLSRAVFRGETQFQTVSELKEALTAAWEAIPLNSLQVLYKSLPKRIISVLENRGGSTKY